ncbi:conserved protein of unknown function [Magnetospirillum sp. XM-1]|uniref:DUF4384 domain-containing protein n=1 Tax=Magnetospirillum sp. XM-1 TaxID=1663591 RepID=UPI00073DFC76|nr:DUF4384 domain-containing protein [Magnetospirillum sp. XM-1]CUW41233.1 conserved protein of unknown function [Magnetospirillum sp. XM-1]
MKKSVLIIGLIALPPQSASAEWVRASGSYIFPPVMTEAEACQQAETRARADAVRQVTGETLSSEEAMRCTEQGDEAECARNSTVWTMVGGDIRSIRDRKVETMVEVETFRKCVVSFEADVHVAEGRPDPNFDVGVALNNTVYRDGENLNVTLKPSQPMAVQIFQWLPYEKGDTQVGRIFPNQFDAADRIAKSVTIPTEAGAKRYDLKVSFPSGQPSSRKMVDEYLMVVATKKPMVLRDSYSLDDFNRVVAEIPQGDRRIVRRLYNIVRGAE